MRRTLIIAGIVALVSLTVGIAPAGAHFCSSPAQVAVTAPGNVTFGVAAEADAVDRFDIAIGRYFTLDKVVDPAGWTVTRAGTTLRFSGRQIAPYTCAFVTVRGSAHEKGIEYMPVTTHTVTGATLHYTGRELSDPRAAQVVYAGVEPGVDDAPASGRQRLVQVAGYVLIGAGLVVGGLSLVRRRRSGEPETESPA